MSLKLGESLVAHKLLSEAQLKTALDTHKQIGGKLGTILVKLRYLTEQQLAQFLGEQQKIPLLQLSELVLDPKVSALVDVEVCRKHMVLPISRHGEVLRVAAADPMDLDAADELQFVTGLRIEFCVAARSDLVKAIEHYFQGKPCPEIKQAEKAKGFASGLQQSVTGGTRASPQVVLQALTELLIEKKAITREELLAKVEKSR